MNNETLVIDSFQRIVNYDKEKEKLHKEVSILEKNLQTAFDQYLEQWKQQEVKKLKSHQIQQPEEQQTEQLNRNAVQTKSTEKP
eukprot:snap_masked-scaffold_45-processed-gene-1.64-mRNA-1 protein AED:0.42 eAED:1.00 QI:0/-1/0/1/-1/1/1/0/83